MYRRNLILVWREAVLVTWKLLWESEDLSVLSFITDSNTTVLRLLVICFLSGLWFLLWNEAVFLPLKNSSGPSLFWWWFSSSFLLAVLFMLNKGCGSYLHWKKWLMCIYLQRSLNIWVLGSEVNWCGSWRLFLGPPRAGTSASCLIDNPQFSPWWAKGNVP